MEKFDFIIICRWIFPAYDRKMFSIILKYFHKLIICYLNIWY